jgi:ubiquinone/menaquinone biosynthesis C-methylase UbiE
MRSVADWSGRDVLDLGCGSGFHLPRFATTARSVTGVEPHPGLVSLARRRWASTRRGQPGSCAVQVLTGTAQDLPLPPASVDVLHARWAYFFGPGCESGLVELDRVVRRGGVAFVIDNDARTSTFGRWFRSSCPTVDPDAVERFWSSHGWQRIPVATRWQLGSRAELEAVVRIELDPPSADRALAGHEGTVVDYAVNVWWRRW